MQDRFATIARTYVPANADLIKSVLDAHNVPVFLLGDSLAGLRPLGLLMASGGIRIQVPVEYAQNALNILRNTEELQDIEVEGDATPGERDEKLHALSCPKCASTNLDRPGFSQAFLAIAVLLAFIPLLFARKKLVCKDCGHHWRQ